MKTLILTLAFFTLPAMALDWVWVTPHGDGPIGSCTDEDKQVALKDAQSRTETFAKNSCGIPNVKYISDLDPPKTWCSDANEPNYRARAFLSQKWECLEEP